MRSFSPWEKDGMRAAPLSQHNQIIPVYYLGAVLVAQ